ncbi:MAG: radical SAM protein, partial [Rikenellaceae bacterium]|nr:radical SAM protein [Rikenellaceae bacterium]
SWALRQPESFPVDVNRADYEMILRVPGIGVKSAKIIVSSRRYSRITASTLKKIGVVMKKAQYFLTCGELTPGCGVNELRPEFVRRELTRGKTRRGYDLSQTVLAFPE